MTGLESDPAILDAQRRAEYWQGVFDTIGGKIVADRAAETERDRAEVIEAAKQKAAADFDKAHRTTGEKKAEALRELAASLGERGTEKE